MFIRQCLRQINGKRQAYWALVESHRTARGPRQRVVAWLGKLDEAGRLGVQQTAETGEAETASATGRVRDRQQTLFEEQSQEPQPRWVEVNVAGIGGQNFRPFCGPLVALEIDRPLGVDEFLQRM